MTATTIVKGYWYITIRGLTPFKVWLYSPNYSHTALSGLRGSNVAPLNGVDSIEHLPKNWILV